MSKKKSIFQYAHKIFITAVIILFYLRVISCSIFSSDRIKINMISIYLLTSRSILYRSTRTEENNKLDVLRLFVQNPKPGRKENIQLKLNINIGLTNTAHTIIYMVLLNPTYYTSVDFIFNLV